MIDPRARRGHLRSETRIGLRYAAVIAPGSALTARKLAWPRWAAKVAAQAAKRSQQFAASYRSLTKSAGKRSTPIASLATRPMAARPAACALAHMAERRHRSDLSGHDSKQPSGTLCTVHMEVITIQALGASRVPHWHANTNAPARPRLSIIADPVPRPPDAMGRSG